MIMFFVGLIVGVIVTAVGLILWYGHSMNWRLY